MSWKNWSMVLETAYKRIIQINDLLAGGGDL